MGTTFTDEIDETINVPEVSSIYQKTAIMGDTVVGVVQMMPAHGYPMSLSQNLTVAPTTTMSLAVAIAQRMLLGDSQSSAVATVLAQTINTHDATNLGRTGSLADTVNLSLATQAAIGLVLAQALGISATPTGNSIYALTLAQLVRVADLLGHSVSGTLADTLLMAPTLGGVYRPLSVLGDTAILTATGAPVLLVAANAAEHGILTDTLTAQSFYDALLSDEIDFTAALVSPSGDVTTWAINTRTGAATEYQNYDFNSFAPFGVHYLGAASTGLYTLDGDSDAGTSIIARLKTGFAQFGGTKYAGIKAAYLGVRGGGNFTLNLITGDGTKYSYAITNANTMASTKVHLGKGLRSRYYAFELISAGQDFDLDNLELIPVVFERRV